MLPWMSNQARPVKKVCRAAGYVSAGKINNLLFRYKPINQLIELLTVYAYSYWSKRGLLLVFYYYCDTCCSGLFVQIKPCTIPCAVIKQHSSENTHCRSVPYLLVNCFECLRACRSSNSSASISNRRQTSIYNI